MEENQEETPSGNGDSTSPKHLTESKPSSPSPHPSPSLAEQQREQQQQTAENKPSDPDPAPNKTEPNPPPSRKSERKRKVRLFTDASDAGSPAASLPAHKMWTEADEVSLLKAAAVFRARTGSAPRIPTMVEFFDSVKGSINSNLSQDRVYYKLKRLKSKFLHTEADSLPSGLHERILHELSSEVWGGLEKEIAEKEDGDEEEDRNIKIQGNAKKNKNVNLEQEDLGNGSEDFPFVREVLREYWRQKGNNLSEFSLETGMKTMDRVHTKELERKWRKQIEMEMRLSMKRHEIFKEVYGLFIEAVKGFEP